MPRVSNHLVLPSAGSQSASRTEVYIIFLADVIRRPVPLGQCRGQVVGQLVGDANIHPHQGTRRHPNRPFDYAHEDDLIGRWATTGAVKPATTGGRRSSPTTGPTARHRSRRRRPTGTRAATARPGARAEHPRADRFLPRGTSSRSSDGRPGTPQEGAGPAVGVAPVRPRRWSRCRERTGTARYPP